MTVAMPDIAADFDPLAELAELARRQRSEKAAGQLLTVAKVRLVTGRAIPYAAGDDAALKRGLGVSAFFSSLIRRTRYVPDWNIDTACTDGKRTRFRPDFVAELGEAHVIGLLAHEVLHDAFGDHAWCRNLEHDRANVAADLAKNWILREAGITLPACALFPNKRFLFRGIPVGPFPPGLSRDSYYSLLPDAPPRGEDGEEGEQGSEGGDWGQFEAPADGNDATDRASEQLAKQILSAAYQEAKLRGTLPGDMERMVDELLAPTINWRDVVQDWATRQVKQEHSWARPSRKWLAQGHYLPSLSGEGLGHLVFMNDTSGSLDNAESRARLRSEAVAAAMCAKPALVTIIHHDSVVQRVETWRDGDGELPWHPKGGGGTDHRPVFEALTNLDEPPDAVVALTDLVSVFPASAPDCPVLWATTEELPAPEWGKKVLMRE
jgi:predicted metal-dependent peptidase